MSKNSIVELDYFVDLQPREENFKEAVFKGLALSQKAISPKFFYDSKGSEIFDKICTTSDYYVTQIEVALLNKIHKEIRTFIKSGSAIMEYGCGSSVKIRALLSALPSPTNYIAIDISKSHLIATAKEVAADYPNISVGAICADFGEFIEWPKEVPIDSSRRVAFFPGSTIGNQTPSEAREFLNKVRFAVGSEGLFLVGVDLKKNIDVLNRAYNDSMGYTADFNSNLLYRMKKELNAELNMSKFSHHAFYNEILGRVEMHLVSDVQQNIRIDDSVFSFKKGESIHTENSYKYSIEEFIELAKKSGFGTLKYWNDNNKYFGIFLMQAI